MRTILVVALSLAFGLAAAIVAAKFVSVVPNSGDTVGVVVVKAEVDRYTLLGAEHLTTQQYPTSLVPPGAITSLDEARDRMTDVPLVKGEPVLESKLIPKEGGSGIAATIPKGMRAVTIQTPNVATGVAGFVRPGNKVDVLFTRRTGGQDDPHGGGLTMTLLQNIEVRAVDQHVDAPSGNKVETKEMKSVTLLVTPDQATDLDLAQSVGTLHLTLRNPLDKQSDEQHKSSLRWIELGRKGVAPVDLMVFASAATLGAVEATKPVEVAVAPPPHVEPEKPVGPAQPLRIRTMRAGIPGLLFIE